MKITKFHIILLISLLLLCGCKNTEIEQEVDYVSSCYGYDYCYTITTKIYIKRIDGSHRSLPYYERVTVPEEDFDIVKELELKKAKIVEKRIGEKYEMLSREE